MAGNNSIQFLRGTSSQRETHSETSLIGQPIYETNTNKLYVGDGATLVKDLEAIHAGEAEMLTAPFAVGKDTTSATTGYVKFASVSLPDAYRSASARFEVLDKNPVNAQTPMCGVEVVVRNIGTATVTVTAQLLYGSAAYLSKIYACAKTGTYPINVDLYFDITATNPQESISCIKPLFTFGRTTVGVEFTFITDNEPVTALPTDTTNTQLSTAYTPITEAAGAEYLSKYAFINAGTTQTGWWKVGTINTSVLNSTANPSIKFDVNGLYASQVSAGAAESGQLEFEARRSGGSFIQYDVTVLSGNLTADEICAVLENDTVALYIRLPSQYNSFKFTILTENTIGEFTFVNTYYGATAPDGAVYAVVRNNASELNGKAASEYAQIDGSYAGLGAGILLGTSLQTGADINDCIPTEFGQKQLWYNSSINNSFLNLPDGVAGTTFTVESVKAFELDGKYRVYQELRSISNNPSKENIFIRCRDTSGSAQNWTQWETITTSIGSYPKMGAGYLAKQLKINPPSAYNGYVKIGTVPFNSITTWQCYNCIMLISGIYRGSDPSTGTPMPTGQIEIETRKYSSEFSTNDTKVGILFGDIQTSDIFYVFDSNNDISVYFNITGTEPVTVVCEIISEQTDDINNPSIFVFDGQTKVASAPSGAIYAVNRNFAAKADKLSNTSAVGSSSQPVYFSADGVPVACTNSLDVNITGNAGNAGNAETATTADKVSHSLTAKVNTTTVTFDGSSAVTIPTVFAPNSGGATSNWLRGNGTAVAPTWDTLPIDGISGVTNLNTAVNTRTVYHGLGSTPTKVFCQLYNPSNNGTNYFVTAVNSTTFTVEFYSSGTGGAQSITGALYWLALK